MNMRKPVNLHPAINENFFLASLPASTKTSIIADLRQISVKAGEILDWLDIDGNHIFFPTDTVISLQNVIGCGKSSEIMTISRDGVVGIANWLASGTNTVEAVVQQDGHAYCIRGQAFKHNFEHDEALRSLTLRYLQFMISCTAQTATCNRHHSIEQQLCRKLLLTLDLTASTELYLTHDTIATAFGVRREGITQAATRLRDLGIISYRRGHITVLSRSQLEELSCECYERINAHNLWLLPSVKSNWQPAETQLTYGVPRARA